MLQATALLALAAVLVSIYNYGQAFTVAPSAAGQLVSLQLRASATTSGHTQQQSISNAQKLRNLLASGEILVMPCCYDGLTARLVEQGGFPLTFMTGFGVSATAGFPDTQLISYKEMMDRAAMIVASLQAIPCIGDGDTGYGNAVNVKRTVRG